MGEMAKKPHCIIVGSTVTGTCTKMNTDCGTVGNPMEVAVISTNYTTISGTLMTTNIVMANWSRQMWQDVVNKAVRMLALGSLESHFFRASVTVS
ncbi:hypothetical protein KIN20_030786 [Parelaphostrongylus tenuis]|uniref:Uncharacterized protein n=1 Tax=Parelaphostrongylus tenuis TaxID=148309 RepID=A0AAD5WGD4_PARTN|nr:hypothetical protein KIN20_030786 [Parelaphostrongylus tenuis]